MPSNQTSLLKHSISTSGKPLPVQYNKTLTAYIWYSEIQFIFGQFTQAVVSLYWVYCWTIIQQSMFVVDHFHAKFRYIYTHFFHMFLKAGLVSCYQIVRMKKICICFHVFQKLYRFLPIKLFKCQKKNTFKIQNTQ